MLNNAADKTPSRPVLDKKALRLAAMDLLARREYSYAELRRKLSDRAESPEQLQAVLQALVEDKLQCDKRFTGMYVRTKSQRGDGPAKIRMGLQEKGIAALIQQAAFEEEGIDWFANARDVAQRRFELPIVDARLKDKALRYLVGKGYSFEQAKYALSAQDDE